MAEEKIRCEKEFDEWLKKATAWIEKQKEMLETKPSPEIVEEITKLYSEVIKKGKEFGACEAKAGS
jgi:predicted metal-dependent hydrolase